MVCTSAPGVSGLHAQTRCLSDWVAAHSSLRCHFAPAQPEVSLFHPERGGELRISGKGKWNALEEKTPLQTLCRAGVIHLPLLLVGEQLSACSSTLSFSEAKRNPEHDFPLLIAELKGWVIEPYIKLTTYIFTLLGACPPARLSSGLTPSWSLSLSGACPIHLSIFPRLV